MGFFSSRRRIPNFKYLQEYKDRDMYFVRSASWYWLNEQKVAIADPLLPRVLTLDPWTQIVFLAADGLETIKEYVYHLAPLYSGQIPYNLDQTVLHEINTLLQYRIIELRKMSGRPAQQFD